MQQIIIHCDGCGIEPDATKNIIMLQGRVYKFTANGPQQVVLNQHFCHECSAKILEVIEKLNDPK